MNGMNEFSFSTAFKKINRQFVSDSRLYKRLFMRFMIILEFSFFFRMFLFFFHYDNDDTKSKNKK
jgi:hypothetical protein